MGLRPAVGLPPGYQIVTFCCTTVPSHIRPRKWDASILVYDHLGSLLEVADSARAKTMSETGEYHATGTKKRIQALVHRGPLDGRDIPDELACKARGSLRAHFREELETGHRLWALKPQRQRWGVAL